jgi:hypothetical protein
MSVPALILTAALVAPVPMAPDAPTRERAQEEAALPGPLARAYGQAQGALREGDDGAALEAWKKARGLYDALPADQRYDLALRDVVVRHELRLAESAKARFDRIAPSDAENIAEKSRLFVLLAGDPQALGSDGFAGAYRRVAALNPQLKGVHCQRAEIVAKFHRWLALLPCPEGIEDGECELLKARTAETDTSWRNEVARAQQQCRE